jgi:hypothetical protein
MMVGLSKDGPMRLSCLLVILMAVAACSSKGQDDLAARNSVQSQASTLFAKRDFKGLNVLAEQLRTSGDRTPAGFLKLRQFYRGLSAYDALEARNLADGPNEQAWNSILAEANRWVREAHSPAAYVALANFYIDYAWDWRGNGAGNTVKQDHLPYYYAALHKAHEVLARNKAEASIDPEWYVKMAVLARGEDTAPTDIVTLYKEAMQKASNYDYVYQEIAVNLTPEWHGSWTALDKFANEATDSTRDKQGSALYARIYRSLVECGCATMDATAASWPHMKAGFEDLVKQYPDQWNVNSFAFFACQAKDKATLKAQILATRQLEMPAWNGDVGYYARCKAWALG